MFFFKTEKQLWKYLWLLFFYSFVPFSLQVFLPQESVRNSNGPDQSHWQRSLAAWKRFSVRVSATGFRNPDVQMPPRVWVRSSHWWSLSPRVAWKPSSPLILRTLHTGALDPHGELSSASSLTAPCVCFVQLLLLLFLWFSLKISTFLPFSSATPSYPLLFLWNTLPSNLCSPPTPKADISLCLWASALAGAAPKLGLLSLSRHSEQLSTTGITWGVRQPEYDSTLTDVLAGKIRLMLWEGKRNALAKINQNLPKKQHAKQSSIFTKIMVIQA